MTEGQLLSEAAKFLLEASKAAVTAIIDWVKEIKTDSKTHQQYHTLNLGDIEYMCSVLVEYTGEDGKFLSQFPSELRNHLKAADRSLKELENLLKSAKDLQTWHPADIIKKIYSAKDFKLKFDTELKQLQIHSTRFFEEITKASSLVGWQEVFVTDPAAGLFWLKYFRIEREIPLEIFYTNLMVACEGDLKKTCTYPNNFLKGYIGEYMCDHKTTPVVTVQSFKAWLGLAGRKREGLKSLVEAALRKLAIEGPEFLSPARKLYTRAKDFLNEAQTTNPVTRDLLLKSKTLFEEYASLVEEQVPLVVTPTEDRHLYYLLELEQLLHRDGPKIVTVSVGLPFQKWQRWSKLHGTLTPKQKAQAEAVRFYYEGVAHLRKVKKLLGDSKDIEDKEKELLEAFAKLPNYKKVTMNAWSTEDVLDYLKDAKFGQYCAIFEENSIDGQIFLRLTDAELETDLNITKKFHRERILNFIKAFAPETKPITNTREVEETDIPWLLQSARAQFEFYKKVLKGPNVTQVIGDKVDTYLTEIQLFEEKLALEGLGASQV